MNLIKPTRLKKGDKVAIVSLSSGILGEDFAAHELRLGEKRIAKLGLNIEYMPNSRKGIKFIKDNPSARADDLKMAFADDSIKAIICAIGGDDTFRTIPFLMDDRDFVELVKKKPKIFLGFSDTTNNHLMFYKLGLQTYYGQAFLTDFAEFGDDMMAYTKKWSQELIKPTKNKGISSSPVWYEERTDYGFDQVGIDPKSNVETRGFEVLRGGGVIAGRLLGGCIESLYEQLAGERYDTETEIIQRYKIFPAPSEWSGKILFAETSEERPSPERLKKMLVKLDSAKVFESVAAIIVGKPQDEVNYEEYKKVWLNITEKYNTPIMYNINFGHSAPRCILPYGGEVSIDFDNVEMNLNEPLVD